MILDKIKALFQFIEYLHSNIENFNQYNGLIKELENLRDVKNQLKPEQNYKDKLQYKKVQAELESKFKTLQDNTANLIKAKAKELNLCNFENEPNYSFNGIEFEIRQLKDNFSNEDLPAIFTSKGKYLEYRSQTHKTFLSLQFFLVELDEITKSLFDYFKDTEQNEFEAFETKTIQVKSFTQLEQGLKQGQSKFTLTNDFSSSIKNRRTDEIFFDIANSSYSGTDLENVVEDYTKYNYDKMETFLCDLDAYLLINDEENYYQFKDCEYGTVYLVKNEGLYRLRGFVKHKMNEIKPKYDKAQANELTQKQIALIHVYSNIPITRHNGNEIAKKFGYVSENSGEKLYQNFTRYYNTTDRKGDEGTERKNNEKIKLIKSIVEYLSEDQAKRALEEIKVLEIITKSNYS